MKKSFESYTQSDGYCKGYQWEISGEEERNSSNKDKMVPKSYLSSSAEPGFGTEVCSEITIGSQAWIIFV